MTLDGSIFLRVVIVGAGFGGLSTAKQLARADSDERRRLLNFAVVGGGPTGVQMAGAIAELGRSALAADFRSIDPHCARIIVVEAGPRLPARFSPALSDSARHSLEQLGVEVRLDARVTDCVCSEVSVSNERLPTPTIVWAAGVKASPVAEWLGVDSDRAGRVDAGALALAMSADVDSGTVEAVQCLRHDD
jgi:NADH dehydrogenase